MVASQLNVTPGVRDVDQNTHQATRAEVAGTKASPCTFKWKRGGPNDALRTGRRTSGKLKTPTWTDGGLPTPGRVRSKFCRFSEFRTSQCLTQFAAIFLDPRTEASTVANHIIQGDAGERNMYI